MKSDEEWRYWGKTDPLWGVLSVPGRRAHEAEAWTSEEFARVGAVEFEQIARHWQHYGIGSKRCIEIGCGAGRMTRQLLTRFEQVEAVDVSPHQVERAASMLGPLASRVAFHVVQTPDVPVPPGSCDGMFSCEVFQHFSDYEGIDRYLQRAFVALAPGATVCFNLPVDGLQGMTWLQQFVRNTRTSLERLIGRRAIMEYRVFPAHRLFASLSRIGFVDAELRLIPLALQPGGRHAYFLARKP